MEVRVLHEVCVVLVFIVNMFFVFAFVQTGNSKFMPRTVIETTAILSLDEEIKLNSDEVGRLLQDGFKVVFFYGYNTVEPLHNGHLRDRGKWLL